MGQPTGLSLKRVVSRNVSKSISRRVASHILFYGYIFFVIIYLPYALFGNIDLDEFEKELEIYDTVPDPDRKVEPPLKLNHETLKGDFFKCLRILNGTGRKWESFETLSRRFDNEYFTFPQITSIIRDRLESEMNRIHEVVNRTRSRARRRIDYVDPKITVATTVCGARRDEATTMLKSLLIFNQDAALHLIVFSDSDTVLDVAQDILVLKWTMQERFGMDFTYELHLEKYPHDDEFNWKSLYRMCATERLFFPDLLPHVDSLIYMDTDAILLSNLTKFWEQFGERMPNQEMISAAQNNEELVKGWYGPWLHIPFYGKRGINAGIMLMNLTRLRKFKFTDRSKATLKLYRDKIVLADQDIINVILAAHPENAGNLSCTYNFHWGHCGVNNTKDYNCSDEVGANICFCRAAHYDGVHVVHGNSGTFASKHREHTFIVQLYKAFHNFDLAADSPSVMFDNLVNQFDNMHYSPCRPLTSNILYHNAREYLRTINQMR